MAIVKDLTVLGTARVIQDFFGAAIRGTSIIKEGGTSSQFLKADGSVDSTSYLSLAGGTMSGSIAFPRGAGFVDARNNDVILKIGGESSVTALIDLGSTNAQLTLLTGNSDLLHNKNGTSYTIWDAGNFTPGNYLEKTGGVLTGTVTATGFIVSGQSGYLKADGTVDSSISPGSNSRLVINDSFGTSINHIYIATGKGRGTGSFSYLIHIDIPSTGAYHEMMVTINTGSSTDVFTNSNTTARLDYWDLVRNMDSGIGWWEFYLCGNPASTGMEEFVFDIKCYPLSSGTLPYIITVMPMENYSIRRQMTGPNVTFIPTITNISYLKSTDIAAWAKASTKPTYTLDEVSDGSSRKLANYLPLAGGTMTGALNINTSSSGKIILKNTSGGSGESSIQFKNVSDNVFATLAANSNGFSMSTALNLSFGASNKLVLKNTTGGASYIQFKNAADSEIGILGTEGTNLLWKTHKVWHEGNDGADSGLDADKLDGFDSDFFFGEFIMGTNTAASNDWTGVSKLPTASAMKSGYRFSYWRPYTYASSAGQTMTLTFQDGTTKTINLYLSASTRITTHLGAGRNFDFVYIENAPIGANLYTGAWMVQGYYSDTTYVMLSNYEKRFLHDANNPLYRYKLCGYDKLGKIVPLVITNQTNGTMVDKTPTTVPMSVTRGIVYYNTTTNVTAVETQIANLYNEYTNSGCVYTFNDTVPLYSDVFLVGSYNPATDEFTMDTTTHKSWYCFAPNRASDGAYTKNFVAGKYYWFVGPTHSSNNYLQLKLNNPLYYYNGTILLPVSLPGAAPIGRNLIPVVGSTYNLGSEEKKFATIYTNNIYFGYSEPLADDTLISVMSNTQEGTHDLMVYATGKLTMYSEEDMELGNLEGHNILPVTNNAYFLGSAQKKWKKLYVSGEADFSGASVNFTGATVTGLSGGSSVTAGEWYNIKPYKLLQAGSYSLFTIIENYHSGLTDYSKYLMLLMRWRRNTDTQTNSWHVPYLSKYIQVNCQGEWIGVTDTVDKDLGESSLWVCDTAWTIGGKKTYMFGESSRVWTDCLPMGVRANMTSTGQHFSWKNAHSKRMKFGCAIFKKTGKGHWGWERVSNIAEIELYLTDSGTTVSTPNYYINIRR